MRADTSLVPSAAWRRAATALLRQRFVAGVGGRLAARRALALVYHRVRPEPMREYEVVPCVPVEQFRTHLAALLAIGDIVPVHELIIDGPSHRVRLALTFDDDYASHYRYVLPVLREFGVPATFFLSGRALHGLGPYWWEVLEARMRDEGPKRLAAALDVRLAEPQAIAAACEDDAQRQQALEAAGADAADQLRPSEMSALAEGDMTIGFHTVTHPVLPRLALPERRRVLTYGREALQDLTGQHLTMFAYPHGRVDAASAAASREAGYETAWTGAGTAVSTRSDRWRLPRWEPGAIDAGTLRARALARVLRPFRR